MNKLKLILIGLSILLVLILVLAFTPAGMETHQNQKVINAPKKIAWSVISDVANYNKYATGLTEVNILSGRGEGMVRSCSDGEGSWTEVCTGWDEGNSYSFDVNTDSGFQYPFKKFSGTWSLQEKNINETILTVEFEYQFPQRWMRWMFGGATHDAINEGNATLIANWEKKILEEYKQLANN